MSIHRSILPRARTAVLAAVVATLGTLSVTTSASAQPVRHPVPPRAALRLTAHPSPRGPSRAARRPASMDPRAPSAAAAAKHDYKTACAAPRRGHMGCLILIRTNVPHHPRPTGPAGRRVTQLGYGPADLQSAYNLPSGKAGGGQTVAIVDAYDDPRAAPDLATYRAAYGLPACGSGCFRVVNQNGAASPLPPVAGNSGWDREESLDLDMVSAICPLCHIILVEANSTSISDLGTAEDTAVKLGAKFVSNSFSGPEASAETTWDTQYFRHPGVAITAAAGDNGYGVGYPAASQYVTAVGGTTLTPASGARGWSESVWNGTGSGCSAYESKPYWQHDHGCSRRVGNDVAAVADPNTGVAMYDSYTGGGWQVAGGTSVATPIIASVFALAGTPAPGSYPASYIYAHSPDLYDVTSGSDGSCTPAYLCTARIGYDGPTGWGTPDGTMGFTPRPGGPGCLIAFQATNGYLYTDNPWGASWYGLGMKAGTSPSMAALANGHDEIAFQANNGYLYWADYGGATNTGLGMMAGTSPSIAAVGNSFEIAFQANNGYLYVTGPGGTTGYGLGMMAGTSPAITAMANGSYEVAFQANNGYLYTADPTHGGTYLGLGMMAGTSPSITAVGNSYEIAFQANNGYLYWGNYGGATYSGLGMMAGTSPSITTLANGNWLIAFQANNGYLYTANPGGGTYYGLGMMAGTNPSIAPLGNSSQTAFQANNGYLYSANIGGATFYGVPMMAGTSPSIVC